MVIEIDGFTHSAQQQVAYDEYRSAFLNSEGYRVIRVQNDEVYDSLDDVLETIRLALEDGAR